MAEAVSHALPLGHAPRKLRSVTTVLFRSAICGTVLALVALLTVFGASTWHSANFHDDAPVQSIAGHHDHDAPESGDADSAIHLAAHMVGQGLDLPAASMSPPAMPVAGAIWAIEQILPPARVDAASLLRPPQS